MVIAVASGKGGTGKTTVATSLASVLGPDGQLLDCDVEEPNCHIFMKPEVRATVTVNLPVPVVDMAKCSRCGKCGEVCRFSAIVLIGDEVMTFPEMCHGCGGCSLLCPEGAITEGARPLGVLESGFSGPVEFVHGRLRVGEAMSPPLIREVKKRINREKTTIIDAPPGASCPVITTVKGVDFIILVTEPTPFGLHDLRIAVEAVSALGIPTGVLLNRSDIGTRDVERYCGERGLPLLMEIPHNRTIAEGYARGELLVHAVPRYRERFVDLLDGIRELAGQATDRPIEARS
ncbi:MAG: ATP-binding protein [Pseudomonadota bacterium]